MFVPLVLGDQWLGAIAPLQILAIYAGFQAISSSVPQILRVVGETRYFMLGNIVIALGLQVAFAVGVQFGVRGIAFAWVVAYPLLTLPLFRRAFACIDRRLIDTMLLGPEDTAWLDTYHARVLAEVGSEFDLEIDPARDQPVLDWLTRNCAPLT